MPVFMARGRVRFVLIKPTRPGRLEREGGGSGGRNSAIAMDARASSPRFARLIAFLLTLVIASCAAEEDPHLGTVRVVFQSASCPVKGVFKLSSHVPVYVRTSKGCIPQKCSSSSDAEKVWMPALRMGRLAACHGGAEFPHKDDSCDWQTKYGDIEFGFYPPVAPRTVAHILKLVKLGAYNTNHFFRVDKGFVAQVADVIGGREAPLNEEQRDEGEKTVPGEFSKVKHVRGILSMGRYSDPDSGASSFSMLLGDAPHLDEQYAIFGKVTKGDEVLSRLEQLPTRTEGMFVMPLERITILSTYYYDLEEKVASIGCEKELDILRKRLVKANSVLQIQRTKCLP